MSRKAASASFAADTGGADKQRVPSCICRREDRRRDTITRDWATYPPRDREHCARLAALGGIASSYVEMLTCLQIARDTKTLPADIQKSGLPKQ